MSTKKRQKRIKETNAEYEEAVQARATADQAAQVADEVLFTLDTTGSKSAKRKIQSQLINTNDKINAKCVVSKTEQLLLKRIIEKRGSSVSSRSSNSNKNSNDSKTSVFKGKLGDLWGSDSLLVPSNDSDSSRSSNSNINMKSLKSQIRPGQSYNPSFVDHQEALAEALAVELKNKEKRERVIEGFDREDRGSYGKGAVVAYDEDSEDDEDEEDDDDSSNASSDSENSNSAAGKNNNKSNKKMNKQITNERLTTAQKNKEKAKKQAQYMKVLAKKEKLLLKKISKIPQMMKELERKEASDATRRELDALKREQKVASDAYNELIAFESGLTPLTDELRGSLRTVIPKGSALSGQVNLLKTSGKVLKQTRKRRPNEKPHGGKRQVWIPKQKFHLIK